VNWIQLTHGRVQQVGFCEHGNEPLGSIQAEGIVNIQVTMCTKKKLRK